MLIEKTLIAYQKVLLTHKQVVFKTFQIRSQYILLETPVLDTRFV